MNSVPMSKKLLAVAAILLGAAMALLYLLSGDDQPMVESADAWPAGRWHARPRTADPQDRSELARTLSLPYTGTGSEASGDSGVLIHDPDRVWPGVNLYTSGHAPEAILMSMDGRVLHRWRLAFKKAFPNKPPSVETPFFRRAALLPDGALLALFQGGGLVRLDVESRLEWAFDSGLYNDFHVALDGRIYAIAKEARIEPRIHPDATVLEDSIVVLGADGRLEQQVSLLNVFLESPFAELLQPMAEAGDIFHTNTVDLLEGDLGELVPGFPPGSVLISLREVDIIAVVDLDTPEVLWARRGPWDAQHQPELLESGRILLFDNQGANGRSRVLELDPLTDRIEWQYPGESDPPLSSPEAGTGQRLPNGNTLITESETGRAIEIAANGEVVWEFVSPHRGGARNDLVATLFENLRLPPDAAAFLADREAS